MSKKIEALIARLRTVASFNRDALSILQAATLLERQQAVLKAARKRKRAKELLKKAQPATWRMVPHFAAHYNAEIEEDMALDKLDAPPEEEG